MKKNRIFSSRLRNVLLVVLLAASCVGASELLAMYHYEPELYHEVTDPVNSALKSAGRTVGNTVEATADGLSDLSDQLSDRVAAAWEEYQSKQLPEEEVQITTEPEIVEKAPAVDPTITEIRLTDDQEILTGGVFDIVYFNQRDDAWAKQPYGRDTIGPYGCGPVAMAMAVRSMTGEEVDPVSIAQFAAKHGYWASHSGSYLTIVPGTAEAYGLECESVSGRSVSELYDAILSGHILVALMGPGHFTSGGHFILLRGVTLDGMILVADPSNRDRSLTLWDPQLILDELSSSTSAGGPLWALSVPQVQPQAALESDLTDSAPGN